MAFPKWFDQKFGPYTIELYRDEIKNTDAQIECLEGLLGRPSSRPVLDLCCGWGRHSFPLSSNGHRIVSLDGNEFFVNKFRESRKESSNRLNPALLRGDMRCLPFADRSFRAAYQMYTSFGYGAVQKDDLDVLGEVNRVLDTGAVYLMDLINWNLARRFFDGVYEQEYDGFDTVEECHVENSGSAGPDLLRVKRALIFNDGRPNHEYEFEIRMYEVGQLMSLFQRARFRVIDIWGGFDRQPYHPDRSYRMIILGAVR